MAPDAGAIAALCNSGFANVHQSGFVPEDLTIFCQQQYSVAAIQADLEKADRFYLVLVYGSEVVGCLRMGTPTLALAKPDLSGIELARFYLDAAHRSGGWGSGMLKMAEAESSKLGFGQVWLHVYLPNIRAQEFYYRHGYTKMGEEQLVFRQSHPTGLVLRKRLVEAVPASDYSVPGKTE